LSSSFVFALVNPGSERPLKQEVDAQGLGWRPSFQRRGFVTFKSPTDEAPFTLDSLEVDLTFSRRLCLSLGKVVSRQEALDRVNAAHAAAGGAGECLIHELHFDGRRLERGESGRGAAPQERPEVGQGIGTVVGFGPEDVWAGYHRHAPGLSPDPGGMGGLVLPEEAPSRAWLKLEEAVRFFGLEFSPSDIAVELGCAPGGVILALLNRGVSVVGVDPAKLAPVVMASAVAERPETPGGKPWVVHCRKPAALVGKRDLGQRVTWFLSDMNQSPAVALKECARFVRMCPAIRSALITLKLTDLSQVAEKPEWFAALREMGFRSMRVQQLSVHHHELALLATGRR
ncbi:MAG: hypothetical protein KDL87_05105, partial [Verrucomicrobiae bacterium]|nr:hypothetical protein [Verrucomicrobiae bacterium]